MESNNTEKDTETAGARVVDRRQFLLLGGSLLTAALLLGATNWIEQDRQPSGGSQARGRFVFPDGEPPAPLPEAIRVSVQMAKGEPTGVLHPVEGAQGAVIMVGSVGGGIAGPAGLYQPLAIWLQAEGITALRLECRRPGELAECVEDILCAIDALNQLGVERVVLIGWSSGGPVVINAGIASPQVAGVAALASDLKETDQVGKLAPKSLLLIHGTNDYQLSPDFSRKLYDLAGEPKELVLYKEDGHILDKHRQELLEKLLAWSSNLLLAPDRQASVSAYTNH